MRGVFALPREGRTAKGKLIKKRNEGNFEIGGYACAGRHPIFVLSDRLEKGTGSKVQRFYT